MPEFHGYAQPPYEAVTRERYEQLVKELPPISLYNLWEYETEDYTTGSQELACSAGGCEI
jgi:ribonucleoside-diphosphate reductase alpha chain